MYEEEYILSSFERYFGDKKDKKIVLYGTGKNTKLILDHFKEHNFIGIWNKEGVGDRIFDHEIISCERALEIGVDVVIIVARYQNVPIIFKRIDMFCSENGIPVYTTDGKRQKTALNEKRSFEKYENISYNILLRKMETADIVSFDIFDTILARRVLYPVDIFDIVERKSDMPGFAVARKNAEQQLYSEYLNPNIYEIYDRLKKNLSLTKEKSVLLMNLEIEMEKVYLLPRKKVVELFRHAQGIGKKVFLTSDMYLTKEIISDILSQFDIKLPMENILMSCDYGCPKCAGLFSVLKERSGKGKILHIGDSLDWDWEYAFKYGIDDAFHIGSGLAMLLDSYASRILKYDNTLDNRLVLGEFIAKELNDPFMFSVTNGLFYANKDADVGYSFLAPFFYKWVHWAAQKVNEYNLDWVLFGSRDGYLLLKICEALELDFVSKSLYFYTSRIVAGLAMIKTSEDILYFSHIAFVGSIEDMLQSRFKLDKTEILKRMKDESDDEYVLRHKKQIFSSAEKAKSKYIKYIDSLNINTHKKIGFVDFVATGTCQMATARIMDWPIIGLYFCKVEEKYKQEITVDSLYKAKSIFYSVQHDFLKVYWLLENVLSSHEPTLIDIDEEGRMVLGQESRTKPMLEALKELQQGILRYTNVYNTIDFGNVDKSLTDALVGLMGKKYTFHKSKFFDTLFLDDVLCNTQFDLSDF